MDFNILQTNFNELRKTIQAAIDMDYHTIAINKCVDLTMQKSGQREIIPSPDDFMNNPVIKDFDGKIKILSRLTVKVEDQTQFSLFLRSPNCQKYDLIAILPLNDNILTHVVTQNGVYDIISFTFEQRLSFFSLRKQLKLAVRGGISLEISYSEAIRDSSMRVHMLGSARSLIEAVRGKGIVFGSGGETAYDIRSPSDVKNLSQLLGMTKCVKTREMGVLRSSFSRKTVLGVAVAVKDEEFGVWKRTKSYKYMFIHDEDVQSDCKRRKLE